MKTRKGWVLTREPLPPGNVQGVTLATIIPSRRVTNRAVDDLVSELHRQEYGDVAPLPGHWGRDGDALVMRAAECWYRLTPCDVYG